MQDESWTKSCSGDQTKDKSSFRTFIHLFKQRKGVITWEKSAPHKPKITANLYQSIVLFRHPFLPHLQNKLNMYADVTVDYESCTCSICLGCMHFSLWLTQTQSVLLLWLLAAELSLCFIFFPFHKAWGRSASTAAILLTQPPHPQIPVGGVFLAACHSPSTVPSATCDSSSTWPPGTPTPPPPQSSAGLHPPRLRTPRNKLGTLVMFLLAPQPATPNDYPGSMRVHSRCISVWLISHSVTRKDAGM